MVLVTVNPKHKESTIKQRIAWGRRKRRKSIQSYNVSNKVKLKKFTDEQKDGTKNFANVLTELHVKTIHTSPLEKIGEGTKRIGKTSLNTQEPVDL